MEAKLETLAKHPEFDADFRQRLQALLAWRRDVRRFRRDPLPPGTIERLIGIACLSPSVGLSEPWRFVIVDDQCRRAAIRASFEVLQSGCAQATGAGSRLALCAAEAFRPRRRAVSDRRVRRPHDGARSWARAPHHARDARLLRGHRHPHAVARGAGGRHRRRLGVDPRSGEDRRDPGGAARIGLSSGIFASAIRRRSTIRPRFSAPIGSAGTLRRARSFIVRGRSEA